MNAYEKPKSATQYTQFEQLLALQSYSHHSVVVNLTLTLLRTSYYALLSLRSTTVHRNKLKIPCRLEKPEAPSNVYRVRERVFIWDRLD